jgi:hypothetical protein
MGSDWADFCSSRGSSIVGGEEFSIDSNPRRSKSSSPSGRSSGGHTYEKWQQLGYQVRRGEKAAYKYYGKSIFTEDQVDEI